MRRTATDVKTHVCVCVSVMKWHPTKTAGLIDMLFGMRARVGPSKNLLDRGPDPPGNGHAEHAHSQYIQQHNVICWIFCIKVNKAVRHFRMTTFMILFTSTYIKTTI